MKKILAYSLLIACMSAPLSANAFDLSNLNLLNKNKKQDVVENKFTPVNEDSMLQTLAQLKSQIASTDSAAQNSFLSIVSALASKDEFESIATKLNSIVGDATLTDSYKTNEINSIITKFTSGILVNQGYVKNAISNMSYTQKMQLLSNFKTLANCGSKYANIAQQYLNMSSYMSTTSTNIPSISANSATIKSNATSLLGRVAAIKDLITQVSGISKTVGFSGIGSVLNLIK